MHPFLPLPAIRSHLPDMEARGVSRVCRGPGGFLEAYEDADGDPARLPPWWHARRDAFIARMWAQAERRCEPLYDERGRPTRRHLALIAWAWSPDGVSRVAGCGGKDYRSRRLASTRRPRFRHATQDASDALQLSARSVRSATTTGARSPTKCTCPEASM